MSVPDNAWGSWPERWIVGCAGQPGNCRCAGQPKYLSGRSDTRPDAKYLSGQSDTRPDTHWSVFSLIPAVPQQIMDLGKTRGLFDYKHFLLRFHLQNVCLCNHANAQVHGIWITLTFIGLVISVFAVKLDSDTLLGPLQSLILTIEYHSRQWPD